MEGGTAGGGGRARDDGVIRPLGSREGLGLGNESWTPLHEAAEAGDLLPLEMLLETGAFVDAVDKNNWTPLRVANWMGNTEVALALLAAGATQDAATREGWSRLRRAAWEGRADVVEALLAAGATVDEFDVVGATPLYMAAWEGHEKVVAVLLAAGASVDAARRKGWTPLRRAAWAGHTEVVAALLDAGATVDATCDEGCTPLYMAATMGCTDVVTALLSASATVNAASTNGWTPLFSAVCVGHVEVVAALLAAGAIVDEKGKFGSTPLCTAASCGNIEMTKTLLAAGATVDATSDSGQTALYQAVMTFLSAGDPSGGLESTIKALLAWGAAVPVGLKPKPSLRSRPTQVRAWLGTPYRMTEDEREAAQSKWRMTAARSAPRTVTLSSPADRALGELQAAYDGFVVHPETLTPCALDKVVATCRVMDVRGLRCAHQILLFADRLDLWGKKTAGDAGARQLAFYENVYLPVIENEELEGGEKLIVRAIVQRAAKAGLLAEHHIADMVTALRIHTTLHGKLQQIYRRLTNLETAMDNVGQHLSDTIEWLRRLQLQLQDQDKRQRKVGLIKSAVKLGASLAPIVGGVLSISVDVVEALVDGAPGATAVYELLADPSDVTAALDMMRHVRDADEVFSATQKQALAVLVSPYESVEALVVDLEAAVQVLEIGTDAGTAADDIVVHVDEAEGGLGALQEGVTVGGSVAAAGSTEVDVGDVLTGTTDDVSAADADSAEDVWEEPQEVVVDRLGEHLVDLAADRRHSKNAASSAAPVAHPAVGACEATPHPSAAFAHPLTAQGSTVAAVPGATHGGSPPLTRSHPAGVAGLAGSPPLAAPAMRTCAPSAGQPARGARAETLLTPSRPRNLPPPLGHGAAPDKREGAPAAATAAGAATDGGGEIFFAGVLGWGFDALAAKLVAHVTVGYSPADRDSFAAAVRAGAADHYINGAVVVHCATDAAVANTVACLLGDEWGTRRGTVLSTMGFFSQVRAHTLGQAPTV